VDELLQTVWLLTAVFNFSVNRSFPILPGVADKKPGIGRDMMFEFLLRSILTATAEAGGRLSYNKNYGSGSLAKVLDELRSTLPRKVIPERPATSLVQAIKTDHAKARRAYLRSLAV
jgi:hypothetical protein